MNIGQFVAAEIIILLVINSVEKIIIGLERFIDLTEEFKSALITAAVTGQFDVTTKRSGA